VLDGETTIERHVDQPQKLTMETEMKSYPSGIDRNGAQAQRSQSVLGARDVEVFFDGECPLCMREIRMLQRLDRKARIQFTDIAASGFDAEATGLSFQTLMDRIHGRLPDGTLIEGVEVFRQLYTAVGFGPLVALTRLPGISQMLDLGYRVFAKNRLRLTGRCADGACDVHASPRSAAR
jgi:predicted DCC family thiol-disulfide oxidoreductase YuxK